jgi:hypothetical protein
VLICKEQGKKQGCFVATGKKSLYSAQKPQILPKKQGETGWRKISLQLYHSTGFAFVNQHHAKK